MKEKKDVFSDGSPGRFKKAVILGAGRSGQAAEALLRRQGTKTLVLDKKSDEFLSFKKQTSAFQPDTAIISPGFAPDHPWVRELKASGIPLLSEMELGWLHRRCPVIAVTGSNGKSTAVKWISEALFAAGRSAVSCGNYGVPVCRAVMQPERPDWLVIEVSSFQLETVQRFRAEKALLLNILPNHLDRHGNMETYRRLKFRIFENMTAGDTAFIPFSESASIVKKTGTVWKTFGTEKKADVYFEQGRAGDADLRGTWFDNRMLGPAAAAVAAVCEDCRVPVSAVESSARRFEPLPHRMQTVAEIGGVRYINDSKATSLAALCAALESCSGQIHLIAGGRAKNDDFSLAKDLLANRAACLYLTGEASSEMHAAWGNAVKCFLCETLEKAVQAARENAEPGDTVLFSPGCTSYDRFGSFSERGDCFIAAVNALSREGVV